LKTWLIDTPLFVTLAPLSSQKSGLRHWLDMHREPVFLSMASLVEIEAAIERVPASQQPRICALRDWLDGLISTSATEFTLSTPQSPFGRVSFFPIAMPGTPVIAFMTWCSSRPLRRMVIAC
jgi:hypothetical protein